MDICPVDASDDEVFARWFAISDEAQRFQRPMATMWSEAEARIEFCTKDPGERVEVYAAFDGDQMVGTLVMYFPLLDNTDMVWLEVGVAPADRRRGIGSELVDCAAARCRAEGRTIMLTHTGVPFAQRETHPYLRFAEKNGFDVANVEIHRVLDLPVDEALLKSLIDEAAPHHTAYRIERFVDGLPAELVPSYCHVYNQLGVDAPTGDIEFEAEALTPEIWRQRQEVLLRQGRHQSTTVAIAPTDEIVAYSDLIVPSQDWPKVYQWGTLVHREHRGHRLGMAVKARNLLELQREHPDRRSVHTGNAEVNQHMIDINERLGFRPVEVMPEFQRKLTL